MKLWHKLLIGTSIGIVLGIFLPLNGGDTQTFLRSTSDILLNLGTYILLPMVFFQVLGESYELAKQKSGIRFVARGFFLLISFSFALSFFGGLSVLLLSPERIPIIIEESALPDAPTFFRFLQTIIAPNVIQALGGNVSYLIAVFVFGVIFGLGLHKQAVGIKPIIDFQESVTRVLHTINKVVVDILLYGTSILAAHRLVTVRQIPDLELFLQVILLVFVLTCLIILVIYPLVMFFFGKVKKPFAWIRHFFAPGFLGYFSGHNFLPLGVMIQSAREEYGLPRRVWLWFYPAASLFGRAGTALVSSVAFILILKSYSSLEISFLQFFYVIGSSVIVSFILGVVPQSGLLVSLSMLSGWYGQGLSEGFLILQPAAPILISFAVLLDVATQVFIASLLGILPGKDNDEEENIKSNRFRDEFMLS